MIIATRLPSLLGYFSMEKVKRYVYLKRTKSRFQFATSDSNER
jgi:hypothetical protein